MAEHQNDSSLQQAGGLFAKTHEQKGLYEAGVEPAPSAENATAKAPNPFEVGTDTPAVPTEKKGRSAKVRIRVAATTLIATASVDEPEPGGDPVNREMIDAALAGSGVVFGILEEGIAQLLQPLYETEVTVAKGLAAVDGEDGICEEMFARDVQTNFVEKEDGTVNYKELGHIRDVAVGTIVCRLTPPTEGTPGTNVLGKPIGVKSGKKAMPPIGVGIRMTEDGVHAVAAVSGNLVFQGGRFTIEETLRVAEVNYDVGNITFSGDVLVTGDILDGFEIRSGGDIRLSGRVGNVVLHAKGDIHIERGINGTGKAEVVSEKTVHAGFIENCHVVAGQDVITGSIIHSTVECEGNIHVTEGRGIISGGKITAFGFIEAKEIGNDTYTRNHLTVGITPKLVHLRTQHLDHMASIEKNIDEMTKNAAYVEQSLSQNRPVSEERIALLQRTKIALPISQKKLDKLKDELLEIETKMNSFENSYITANILYPPTRISIGNLHSNVEDTYNKVRVYLDSQGELHIGTH